MDRGGGPRSRAPSLPAPWRRGLGSGVIFDTRGNIITNAHVVTDASQLVVTLADGRRFDAWLVAAYVPDDLAVIDIGAGHGISPARLADSSKLAVGEMVLAEGNPRGQSVRVWPAAAPNCG